MTYSQLIIILTELWLDNIETYDRYLENKNIKDAETWLRLLDLRKEVHNKIEELVENSKLYKEKNGL